MGLLSAVACLPSSAMAQGVLTRPQPRSVITDPPRAWGANADPVIYPDPDILVIDPAFNDLLLGITQIRRIWDKGLWLEGPAWSAQGQYLVFSDVQADKQYRYIWETGEITAFRSPSFNSNGNAFDAQGRQIVCEDLFRRIVRHEHDGTITVLADGFEGKGLNSPNDIAVHADGSIWFTDPGYGDTLSEGHPDFVGGPSNAAGRLNPRIGSELAGLAGGRVRGPGNCYRINADGAISKVIDEKDLPDPNGIAFSPDYKTLYVASTGRAPGDTHQGGKSVIYAFDVNGKTVSRQRLFSDMTVDGVKCSPDGFRVDVNGNLWCGVNGPMGYGGVQVLSPTGKLLGRIRLPQLCANLTFAGPKRNMLMMCCGQSLYTLQVQTQGAAFS
ncbi:SMP-30/gluconolactonase/LRE family protein [Novosphingobium sp. 9]|uniref:SMP-30/gluconolactonase/LRE family protein n=1 Tax=Novosphingobium sp. 9 TaxID=2025349 RepID=UPI0021B4E8E1|nr:SMP-30/gluconolactonase/LRE family protein [Novosphingobium sp. 9]